MRIVSGLAGGIRLNAPRGREVRPTEDRVKESVFGVLGDIVGWRVADLFAGTGALGLEALSRGASSVLFVERNARVLRFLQENLTAVLHAAGEEAGSARVLKAGVESVPRVAPEQAGNLDLILADPPYAPQGDDFGAVGLLSDEAFAHWAGDALLVLEHSVSVPLPWAPRSQWRLLRQKRYGQKAVSFARCGQNG